MNDKKTENNPLLCFILDILQDDDEKKIISMVFEEMKKEEIIEKFINYSHNEVVND